jgi:hypothetical protein
MARSARSCFSRAARWRAARSSAVNFARTPGESNSSRNSFTCCCASSSNFSNLSSRRKLLAPAPTRTRTPSWLMRLTFTTPCSTNEATTCVKSWSKADP